LSYENASPHVDGLLSTTNDPDWLAETKGALEMLFALSRRLANTL